MQTISENLKTLLKSKAMVGANAPTARLTLEGVTGSSTFSYLEETPTWRTVGYDGNTNGIVSNFVQDANGEEICAIVDETTGEIKIGKMAANKDYFTKAYPVTSLTTTGIYATNTRDIILHKRGDGKILMGFTIMPVLSTSPGQIMVYISDNGLGTDFAWYATISMPYTPTGGTSGLQQLSLMRETSDGTLYWGSGMQIEWTGGYTETGMVVLKSTDGGQTWAILRAKERGYGGMDGVSSCIKLNNGELVCAAAKSSLDVHFAYSSDEGTTWTDSASEWLCGVDEILVADFYYDETADVLYLLSVYVNASFVIQFNNPTATKIQNMEYDAAYNLPGTGSVYGYMYKNYDGDVVIHAHNTVESVLGGQITYSSVEIPLKSVKIDREQSALAQRLSAEIVNANPSDPSDVGYYTLFRGIDVPEKLNAFYDKIKPGTGVTCDMGYGTELTKVFTGAIDDVEISADTSYNIGIECRDNAWKILDTIVTSNLGYYILYQNQTIEYMISDLLQKAGIPSGDITTEATGISVAEISFAKCSYADAIEKLLDVCGYDLICNELGKFSLVKPGVVTSGGAGGSGTGTEVFSEDHEAMTTETIEPTYYIVDGSNLVNDTSYWEIATDPVGTGNVIKLGNQAESGPPSYYRAEVACLDCTATDGDVTWLTYKMYIPSAHNNNSEWELMMQWHAQPGPGETWEDEGPFNGEPPVRLVRWSETPETYELWLHDPINLTYAKSDPFELPRDQWLNFTFEIYWSQGSDGYIQGWLDGELLVPKMYHVNKCNSSPNYLQFGSYRRGKDASNNAATGIAELYYDDIAIYTGGDIETTEPGLPTTAYEFTEGVDIIKMGLKLTRNDIYARVQVTSRIDGVDGAPETYIVKEYVYSNAVDYGIPTHKTLFVDVQNITDETDLQAMADQIGYEMTRRLITVEFDCVPVFQLQVGDIIKVTETSTTISEIYRISAMSMGVDASGKATMSLKCFHYGA